MVSKPLNPPWIQVAGVHNLEEAERVVSCGIEYLGFPLRLPVNKEDLSETEARELISRLNPSVKPIIITYLSKARDIADFMRWLGVSMIQLHGEISISELQALKQLMPSLVIIKSLVIGKEPFERLVQKMQFLDPFVDMFITDTFNPKTGACGATGLVHDWSLSRQLVQQSSKPIILAGGLTPENVEEAIMHVKPFGVDVHTGVENKEGWKDVKKIQKFVKDSTQAYKNLKYIR